MSKCISRDGEYSDHDFEGDSLDAFGSEFICSRCFVYDEDRADAEIARLRATVDRVRALADHLAGTEWFRMTHGAAATRIYAALDGAGEQR